MRKYRPLGIILIAVVLVLALRFAYYTVIKSVKNNTVSLNIDHPSISGIYPHLAVFNENFRIEKPGETGIGCVVPWGDFLYAITYSAHKPKGSSDKLYVIDKKGNMEIHPLSVGGTPANRMIHTESEQLIIGPYFIKKDGEVRVISQDKMPGRLTATTRHLEDPANKVYFYTMEEGLYEVDVNTLEVKEIYTDGNMMNPPDIAGPLLPGYHGKGAYVSQNRLVVANNGEYHWRSTPESGCLAEWDGRNWKVIERKQFTEVTGPGGLYGNKNQDDQIWSTGWDKKSLILKVRDNGEWFTYRLPKASFTYDGRHGWHTEWPRIRDIGIDNWLMTMHGMFWAFPPDFSSTQTSGIRPYSSYLKIIPDFTAWQGMIVMGCDDASSFDNAFVGQPQSNFWFIKKGQLDDFGPKNAYASLWLDEKTEAFEESDPILVAGFDQLMISAYSVNNDAFKLNIEVQKTGEMNWEVLSTEIFGPFQSVYRIINPDEGVEWIRLSPDKAMNNFSVHLHLSQQDYQPANTNTFTSLSGSDSEIKPGGWLRPNGDDRNLSIYYADDVAVIDEKFNIRIKEYEGKDLSIKEGLLPDNEITGADSASVFYTDKNGLKWRMPWGTNTFDKWYANEEYRIIREVATERSLMNIGGIFYELPREISGGINKIKPISTHNRKIMDFCSWRGLMVITEAENGPKLGTIDDLWSFGKPTGTGGPWYNTEVKAGELSDPFLMLGFDNKELTLSHDCGEAVSFELYADFTGEGEFKVIQVIRVNSGEVKKYEFPDGFSANWIRLKSGIDCQATSIFRYQ